MRIRHSTSIDHLIHAAAETVANEYLSIANATEHEFRNERERGRYAALVRAWGLCCITRGRYKRRSTVEFYAMRIVVGDPICEKRLRTFARTLSSVV